MKSHLEKLKKLISALIRQPREMAHIIANAPCVLDGGNFAKRLEWGESNKSFFEAVPPPPVSNNPLLDYFLNHNDGPGITKWLHYFEPYQRHLSKFVGREQVRLLEIGVYSGGSLGMWRSYLGEGVNVTGIDIAESCRSYEGEGVEIVIGDQGNPNFWREFLKDERKYDIVIDDGGHLPKQQQETVQALLERLSPGGIFMCEDIHACHQPFHAFITGMANALNGFKLKLDGSFAVEPTPFQTRIKGIYQYPYMAVVEIAESASDTFACPRKGTSWQPFGA